MARIDDLEKGLVDQYGVQVRATLDTAGNEIGDPVPLAPPAHLRRSMTMAEQIQQMIRREVSLRAQESDYESFEEADDFDVDDDPPDPHTPYEAVFDPPPPVTEKQDGRKDDNSDADSSRVGDGSGRSGKRGKVEQDKPKSGKEPDDKGSVREASSGDQSVEE